MRTYTVRAFKDGNINAADNVVQELRNAIEPLNNQLDGHNLPLKTISEQHLTDCVAFAYNQTVGTIGPVRSHYRVGPRQSDLTFSASSGNIFQGWNTIESDFRLEFEAREGMIKGAAVICGRKYATFFTSGGLSVEKGTQGAWELAVFANGVMIAISGLIPAGTFTIDLPFSAPVGSEFVTIEAKWRLWNSEFDNDAWTYPDFHILDRFVWAVNQCR
jgi:hypothetical protein